MCLNCFNGLLVVASGMDGWMNRLLIFWYWGLGERGEKGNIVIIYRFLPASWISIGYLLEVGRD